MLLGAAKLREHNILYFNHKFSLVKAGLPAFQAGLSTYRFLFSTNCKNKIQKTIFDKSHFQLYIVLEGTSMQDEKGEIRYDSSHYLQRF